MSVILPRAFAEEYREGAHGPALPRRLLYELSGDWLYEIGLPGKSGVSGGIVIVSPGKGGLGTFSPALDEAGNSVRGQRVSKYLSERMGLNLSVASPPCPRDSSAGSECGPSAFRSACPSECA